MPQGGHVPYSMAGQNSMYGMPNQANRRDKNVVANSVSNHPIPHPQNVTMPTYTNGPGLPTGSMVPSFHNAWQNVPMRYGVHGPHFHQNSFDMPQYPQDGGHFMPEVGHMGGSHSFPIGPPASGAPFIPGNPRADMQPGMPNMMVPPNMSLGQNQMFAPHTTSQPFVPPVKKRLQIIDPNTGAEKTFDKKSTTPTSDASRTSKPEDKDKAATAVPVLEKPVSKAIKITAPPGTELKPFSRAESREGIAEEAEKVEVVEPVKAEAVKAEEVKAEEVKEAAKPAVKPSEKVEEPAKVETKAEPVSVAPTKVTPEKASVKKVEPIVEAAEPIVEAAKPIPVPAPVPTPAAAAAPSVPVETAKPAPAAAAETTDEKLGKIIYEKTFLLNFMEAYKGKPSNIQFLESIGLDGGRMDKKMLGGGSKRTGGRHATRESGSAFSDMVGMHMNMQQQGAAKKANASRSAVGFMPAPGAMGSFSGMQTMGFNSRDLRSGKTTPKGRKGGPAESAPPPPLPVNENRWVPKKRVGASSNDEETVARTCQALLNKLTLEKFEPISGQIVDLANKSTDEADARSLRIVIKSIFEKATDEPHFGFIYAALARRIQERIKPEVAITEGLAADVQPMSGGVLFRKLLIDRCQQEFERLVAAEEPERSVSNDASEETDETGEASTKTDSSETAAAKEGVSTGAAKASMGKAYRQEMTVRDEYYKYAKAKRRGLGLIRFIGELFKRQMLLEKIMHGCITRCMKREDQSLDEEELEALCKLLTTVGANLDHGKSEHMERYFEQLDQIRQNPALSSRVRFMIMDLIDLRKNNWESLREANAPKTIAEIHEEAARAREESESMRRSASSTNRGPMGPPSMQRGNSYTRGGRLGGGPSQDSGWSTIGARSKTEMSNFGDLSRSKNASASNLNLGPGGVFSAMGSGAKGWKAGDVKDDKPSPSMSRSGSHYSLNKNMFR